MKITDDPQNAFNLCSGNLASLPAKFKKWKTMDEYRSKWTFLRRYSITENICENHMSFHYMLSLHLWLKPVLTIKLGHNLLCLQSLVGIFEAVLFDLLATHVNDIDILKDMTQWPSSKIRNIIYHKKLINENWNQKLSYYCNLRNCIHLQKDRNNKKNNNFCSKLHQLDPEALDKELDDFCNYTKDKWVYPN